MHFWSKMAAFVCLVFCKGGPPQVLFFETADKTVNGGKYLSTMYLSSTMEYVEIDHIKG